MKAIAATLSLASNKRKYNENVRKSLKEADINFTEKGCKFGKQIIVDSAELIKAHRVILSISLK